MKKYLLIFLLLNYCSAAELVVFNVGQGNCNLFVPDQKNSNGALIPVLYDAGSDHYPQDVNQCKITKSNVIREIVTKIKAILPEKSPSINVVVGHGDTDHYSYILEILNRLPKEVKFYLFLGGNKGQYNTNFIKKLMSYPNSQKKLLYFASDEKEENPSIGEPYLCEILSRLNTTNKNTNSLVLKISLVNGFSILLTGDATKETIAQIKSTAISQTTILLASHHGAETEGSNSEQWVTDSNPQIVLFSSSRTKNGHPRSVVVDRYLKKALRLNVWPIHEFSYTGDILHDLPNFATYHTVPEQSSTQKYFHAVVRKALFNTMNEGTLRFCLADSITVEQPKCYFSMFPLRNLVAMNLSGIGLENHEFSSIVPKLHVLLLLETANFDDNNLILTLEEGKEVIEKLKLFLQAIKGFKRISFMNNKVDVPNIKTIITEEYFPKIRISN